MPGPKAAEARTEALRVLRSNLLVSVAELSHPVVVITSANRAEGKTATCHGLARSLALAGRRVVVADLDLRHPELHERLGATNDVGVVDVLAGRVPLAKAVQDVAPAGDAGAIGGGLYFLAAGQGTGRATELLGTPDMARLLDSLASQADIVLADSAPVLPVADTLVVGRMAAGVVLVVEAGRTSESDVSAAHDALTRNQVRVFGIALNKLDPRQVRLGYGADRRPSAEPGGAGPADPRWAPTWAEPPS